MDISPQKYYPFEFHFKQRDALDVLRTGCVGHNTWIMDFDAIHASPPCQAYSSLRSLFGKRNYGEQNAPPDLLPGMLARLAEWGNVWVVENVVGAPVPDPFMLCGSSFGLEVRRHRLFASPLLLMGLPCRHDVQGTPTGVYDSGGWKMRKSKKGGLAHTHGGPTRRYGYRLGRITRLHWPCPPPLTPSSSANNFCNI